MTNRHLGILIGSNFIVSFHCPVNAEMPCYFRKVNVDLFFIRIERCTYIEGQTFVVRTDHDALRWLLTLSDPSVRLMRWRLRLSEFDFEIQYLPGCVHQVPDALIRLISPGSDLEPVDDESPTFGDHNLLDTNRTNNRRSAADVAAASNEYHSTKELETGKYRHTRTMTTNSWRMCLTMHLMSSTSESRTGHTNLLTSHRQTCLPRSPSRIS